MPPCDGVCIVVDKAAGYDGTYPLLHSYVVSGAVGVGRRRYKTNIRECVYIYEEFKCFRGMSVVGIVIV